jgi:hypothetical protein
MERQVDKEAFVQTTYRRKRHIGYSVFVEWFDNGVKHGRLVKMFDLKDYDGNAEIALHLANTLRDDILAKQCNVQV